MIKSSGRDSWHFQASISRYGRPIPISEYECELACIAGSRLKKRVYLPFRTGVLAAVGRRSGLFPCNFSDLSLDNILSRGRSQACIRCTYPPGIRLFGSCPQSGSDDVSHRDRSWISGLSSRFSSPLSFIKTEGFAVHLCTASSNSTIIPSL